MNIVDSSGWLEYIAQSPRAHFFVSAIEDVEHLLIPSIILYEVFKKVLHDRGEQEALQVAARMFLATIADIDATIALAAARTSVEFNIPMADSIIVATARQYQATIFTQDADLKGLPGVEYFPKKKSL